MIFDILLAICLLVLFVFLICGLAYVTFLDVKRIKRREAAEILKVYSELKGELFLKDFLKDIETVRKELK